MKKVRLFLLLLMVALLPTAMQAQQSLPYSYGFENNDLAAEGWTKVDCASSTGINSSAKMTGDYGFQFYYNTNPPQYLISPELTGTESGVEITFYYKNGSTWTETFQVGYSTTDADVNSFTWDAQLTAPADWTTYNNTFPAGTKFVALKYTANNQFKMYIDDFSFSAPAACPKPTGLAYSNVTINSATLTWEAGDASAWILEYATSSDFTDATSENVTGTASKAIEGLTAQTHYYVRVKANCGADGESEWSNAIDFTTACNATVVDADHAFTEDFTGLTSSTFPRECWSQERTETGNTGSFYGTDYPTGAWTVGTTTQGTGSNPPMAQLRDTRAGSRHNLVTPPLSMAAGNYVISVNVYRNATGSNYPTEGINLYVSKTADLVSEGNDAVDLGFISRNYQTASTVNADIIGAESASGWYTYEIPFSPATDGIYYVIFEGRSQYGSSTYMDDIAVSVAPTCLKPSDVALVEGTLTATGAKIEWTDNTAEPIGYILLVNDEEVEADENPFMLELTPETQYTVRVKAVCTATDTSDWSTSSVSFTTPPTCPAPTSLTYSNLTATSVTLDWTNGGNEEQWILVLNGQEIVVDQKPLTIDTLTEQTPYTAIIRAFCSGDDTSANSNTARFVTKCGATVVTNNIPFEEDFNSITTGIPQCWDNSEGTTTTASYKWKYYATGATGHCVRFNSYYNTNGYTNMLKTPTLDLTQVTEPKLSFTYKYPGSSSSSTLGNFTVFVSTDGGHNYTSNIVLSSGHVTDWTDTTIALGNLDSYDQVVVVFQGTSDCGSGDNYIYLDNVFVGGTPSCVAPNEVSVPDSTITTTTAIVHWTDNNENEPANGWIILLNDEEVVADVNPFTLPALTPATHYTVKVKANCGTNDESAWSEEVSFTTLCEAIVVDAENDFSEGFEGTTFAPDCWNSIASGTYAWSRTTAYHNQGSASAHSGYYGDIYLVLPDLQIANDNTNVRLTFWSYNRWVDDYVKNSVVLLDGENETELWSPEEVSESWEETSINLSEYKGQTIRLAFKYEGNNAHDWYVDDVKVAFDPDCMSPTALTVDTVTATTVTLTWVDNNTERPASWTVSYTNSDTTLEKIANDTTLTIEELTPETAYTAKVKANCGAESASDWSDVVNFTTLATCPAPTNLTYSDLTATSVTLDWTNGGNEEQWILVLNGQELVVDQKPLTIDTLTEQTPYVAILRAFCTDDDTSYNSNTARFVTPCAPQTAEGYTEDFSSYTAAAYSATGSMPDCWNYISNNYYKPHVYNGSSYSPTANDNCIFMSGNSTNPTYVIMPTFDNLHGKMIHFATAMGSDSYGKLSFGYLTNSTDASSYTEIKSIPNNGYQSTSNPRYVMHEVYLPEIPEGARLTFKWEHTSTTNWYCCIDDITLTDLPACVQPLALTAVDSTITATSATIEWTNINENEPEFGWVIKINNEDTTVTANPFTFDNLTPETEYTVKIMALCTDSTESEWSDSITFTTLPTCVAPSDVEVSAITTTSATISWTENNEATQWIINLNGTIDTTVTENPFTFDNLSASTTYTVKVKAICSDEDESDWSAIVTFDTPCDVVVVTETAPFSEDFNTLTAGIPNCWDNTDGTTTYNSYKWTYYASGATGAGLRFDSYNNSNGNTNMLKTPVMDLTALETPYLSFNCKNPTGGDFSVFVSTDGGETYTTELFTDLTGITSWTFQSIVLDNLASLDNVVIVFQGTSNYGPYGTDAYLYLDDVWVGELPTCFAPSDITVTNTSATSLTIDWTDNNETAPQSWTIHYDNTDTTVTEHPFTIDNLDASSSYTVTVKANCTDDDESAWSAEATFETDCDAIAAAGYSEDFSSYAGTSYYSSSSVMATCWSVIYSGDESGYRPYIHNDYYAANSYDNCLLINAGTNDDDDWDWDDVRAYGNTNYAVMPPMTGLNGTTMTYKYKYENTSYGSLTVGYVTDLNASSFQSLHDVAASSSATMDTITFTNVPEGARIAFRWTNDYSYYGVAIDDINITGEPVVVDSCETPTNVAYENGVVTWTGDAANYNVHIVAGETVIDTTVSTATYTIEGLNEGDHATVTVQAICDEDNLSEWSEAVEFDYTVGINNYAIHANIYPNPTTGNVTVESNAINADITVFDMFGKLMMTSKVAAERTELNFSGFAPGVYMVRIAIANATTTIKVVKE